jgi:NAD(P)-dependent dehydrogenase (short-subunit alcohol dehydrogenase family)
MASLANKVGIVTGGGTGIGRATALAMAKAGASLVIGNHNAKLGDEVVRTIAQAGGRAVFQVTDVFKPEDAKALVDRAVKEFGRLDLAFNNAGMDGEQVPLHEQDIEKASSLFDVNIKGVFYCMKFEIEQMLRTSGGAIVNTSSIFGLNGYPGWSLYSATKHAVTGMTKAAALEYSKRGIRVNAVGPGPVETPLLSKGTGGDPHSYAAFVPMVRIGQPEEIADPVVFLLSDEARYVTGHTLPVAADETEYLLALAGFVEKYEEEHHSIPPVSGIDMLRYLYETRQKTQHEVAAGTGLADSTISEILAGKRKLSVKQVEALARFFKVKPAVFLVGS